MMPKAMSARLAMMAAPTMVVITASSPGAVMNPIQAPTRAPPNAANNPIVFFVAAQPG